MGILCHTLAGMRATPTVSMNVQYLNPGKKGDHLLVEVQADKLGRTMIYVSGRAIAESTSKIVATLNGTCIRR